jgi:hypothetical protein
VDSVALGLVVVGAGVAGGRVLVLAALGALLPVAPGALLPLTGSCPDPPGPDSRSTSTNTTRNAASTSAARALGPGRNQNLPR